MDFNISVPISLSLCLLLPHPLQGGAMLHRGDTAAAAASRPGRWTGDTISLTPSRRTYLRILLPSSTSRCL